MPNPLYAIQESTLQAHLGGNSDGENRDYMSLNPDFINEPTQYTTVNGGRVVEEQNTPTYLEVLPINAVLNNSVKLSTADSTIRQPCATASFQDNNEIENTQYSHSKSVEMDGYINSDLGPK